MSIMKGIALPTKPHCAYSFLACGALHLGTGGPLPLVLIDNLGINLKKKTFTVFHPFNLILGLPEVNYLTRRN